MRKSRLLAGIAGLCLAGMATAAHAASNCTLEVTQPGGANFGTLVATNTATTFTISSSSGTVSATPSKATGGAFWAPVSSQPSNFKVHVKVSAGSSCKGSVTVVVTLTSTGTPSLTFPAQPIELTAGAGTQSLLPTTLTNGGSTTLTFTNNGSSATAEFDIGEAVVLPIRNTGGTASWTTKVDLQ